MSKREEAIAGDEAITLGMMSRSGRTADGSGSAEGKVPSLRSTQSMNAWFRDRAGLLRVIDVIAVAAAALFIFGATVGRVAEPGWPWGHDGSGRLLLVAALLAPFCLDWAGLYAKLGSRQTLVSLLRGGVALASLLGLLVLCAVVFTPDWPSSAGMLIGWASLTLALLVLSRVLALALVSAVYSPGFMRDRVAVLGSHELASKAASYFETSNASRLLVGLFDAQGHATRRFPNASGRSAANLRELAMGGAVDSVVIALPSAEHARVSELARELSPFAIDVAVCTERGQVPASGSGPDVGSSQAEIWSMDGLSTLRLVRRPLRRRQLLIKAIEDRVLSLVLLVGLLPVLLAIGLAVKLTSPGPILFKQRRHGLRNREIVVYKFRSMRADATDYGGRVQTRRGDPRVTAVGRFIRASSLDELPQLLNVLRGEMSLVGPRPLPLDMRTDGLLCCEIVEDYANRHRVKPGITGWAQINGYRGATTTAEDVAGRVRLDNFYIDHWSLWLDLKIMVLTLVRVFNDDKAY